MISKKKIISDFEDGLISLDDIVDFVRADSIDECIVMLDKIMPPQPYLIKSKHYETWKMKTTELRMLRDMLEQLKEQI